MSNITIPNSVTSIGSSVFDGCDALTSIIVNQENSVYDSREDCNAIIETATNTLIRGCKNTVIPNSVTNIGEAAFLGCSSLTNITIPNNVTTIDERAFYGCSSLTSITIPNNVTKIGDSAFDCCDSLTRIDVKAINPPTITVSKFLIYNTIKFYVPTESIDIYRTTTGWKDLSLYPAN